jgi:hypothetical protein
MSYETEVLSAFPKKPNNLLALVETLRVNTEFTNATVAEKITRAGLSQAAYYRALTQLKTVGVLTEHGVPKKSFNMPDHISKGVLPPQGYKYVHLAAYLSRFKAGEDVPPFNKTVEEICKEFAGKLMDNPLLAADVVYGIQDRLAQLALATNDLSQFRNMMGTVRLPDEY